MTAYKLLVRASDGRVEQVREDKPQTTARWAALIAFGSHQVVDPPGRQLPGNTLAQGVYPWKVVAGAYVRRSPEELARDVAEAAPGRGVPRLVACQSTMTSLGVLLERPDLDAATRAILIAEHTQKAALLARLLQPVGIPERVVLADEPVLQAIRGPRPHVVHPPSR